MNVPRRAVTTAAALACAVTLGSCASEGDGAAGAAASSSGAASSGGVPSFTVDPSWPLEMPNQWIMGAVTSVFVDAQDHVWVTHLPETLTPEETSAVQDPPIGTCCVPAPVVVEFDQNGAVVQGWGDPATQDVSEFPRNAHGLFVDHQDNVWIGTYRHHRVMKFSRSGELLMQIGEYDENAGSNDPDLLGGPAGIWVDPGTNEVFLADGYRNRRVAVYDGDTGEYLRHWGAYGNEPRDEYMYDYGSETHESAPPAEFSTVHGLVGSNERSHLRRGPARQSDPGLHAGR